MKEKEMSERVEEKKMPSFFSFPKKKDPLTLVTLITLFLLTLLFLILLTLTPSSSSSSSSPPLATSSSSSPSFAYIISSTSSSSSSSSLLRLLLSVYHPNNVYLLPPSLAASIRAHPVLSRAHHNLHLLSRSDLSYPSGSSALSSQLHAAAILLRICPRWDWLINLDADSDYPIVTQDDLLHVFSFLPKDLNFVHHSGRIGWRESRRLRPIVVDPGLYLSSKTEMFYATQKRDLPNAFKLFTGFPSVFLSRKFVEHCIVGTDNLPRILLMYLANTAYAHTNYFQTVLCNSPQFNRTIINHHLHYATWDTPPKQDPRLLSLDDFNNMTKSGAAFATRVSATNGTLLDRIDAELLNRKPESVVPGGWCLGEGSDDPCAVQGAADVLRPGPSATNLASALVRMLSNDSFRLNRCIWDP